MTREEFFEKFELLAEVPDAVAKMRHLVLALAVQGKLVEQRTDEASTDELLRAIELEQRRSNTRSRAIRAAGSDQDHVVPNLPSTWASARLGAIALQIQYGYTASAKTTTSGVRMLRITDIQENRVDWSAVPGCEIDDAQIAKYLLRENDIVVARTGGTIGKSFIICGVVPKAVFASYLIRITPPTAIDAHYLKRFLESPVYWQQLRCMSAGTGQPNVNGQALGMLTVPLPPVAEQKRIVAKVDELMALCDRLEAQQKKRETRHAELARASTARFADAPTTANLKFLFHRSYGITPSDLRETVRGLAVQKLLVAGDQSLARCETKKLKELTSKVGSGSTPLGGKQSYQEAGVPLIRSMNVHFAGFVHDGIVFLSHEQAQKLSSATVKADDVLLNITGASIGRVTTAPKDMDGARVNQHVCIIRPTRQILPSFLALFLASPAAQNLIETVQVGATREALTKAMIEQFEIPVPPLDEQRRIVAGVDELMALVDTLERQVNAAAETGRKLLDAVVAELTSTSRVTESVVAS